MAMDEAAEEQREQGKGRHLALVTLSSQGHMSPMLQLGYLLHSRGFSITIIYLKLSSPNISNCHSFRFEPISDGVPDQNSGKSTPWNLLPTINLSCENPLRECLVRLQGDDPQKPITCLITDAALYLTHHVAQELGIPCVFFGTSSPFWCLALATLPLLRQRGYFPVQDSQREALIPDLSPLRVKDLPESPNTDPKWSFFADQTVDKSRIASALILNSFDHLEQTTLERIHQEFPIPVFLVGPLSKVSSIPPTSHFEQDRSCIDWLNKQKTGSVLYVSFGSLVTMDDMAIVETAWGLANSEQPFLWVIRPDMITGSEGAQFELPDEFVEKTKERGRIVKWAPQKEVLAHTAVGGFWTHCGWNSTLESICEGVPMLCWPRFADQKVTARQVSCVWKVGLQLEGDRLQRGVVEKAVRTLMGENGEEMRGRIMVLKENAEVCVREGGSTYESVNNLVNHILSL